MDVDFTSSLWDVYAYKKLKMNLCGKGLNKVKDENKYLS